MTGEQRYSQNALHSAALLMVDDAVTVYVYVLLDDQSNHTLARSELLTNFGSHLILSLIDLNLVLE